MRERIFHVLYLCQIPRAQVKYFILIMSLYKFLKKKYKNMYIFILYTVIFHKESLLFIIVKLVQQ